MNKLKPYICIFIISLLLEIVVFNFSTLNSLGNKSEDLSAKTSIEFVDNGYVLHVEDIDLGINNLYFDMNLTTNSPVNYDIAMTDEGNYYDYYMPRGTVYATVPSSFYTNLHPYGKVHGLTVTFTLSEGVFQGPFTVNKIIANVKRPLCFNLSRFLVVLLVLLFLYAFRNNGSLMKASMSFDSESKTYKRQIVIMCVSMLAVVILGLFASSSHKLFDEASKPHHQQYKELSYALLNGEVVLPDKPSEGLLNAPNPYDSIYLQANGIEYKADYAYYEGKYYVYFGIVPEVLLYLPYHMITGNDLPNHVAVFLFYALFAVATFLFFRNICCKYFKEISFAAYLMGAVIVTTASTFAYLFFTADLYSVPIMAGISLTMSGLFFWSQGINVNKSSLRIVLFLLGSFCMAMVSGCRPQLLLFSLLAVPMFWDTVLFKRELFSKKSIGQTVAICAPYIIVAMGVMYYNYLRFGSVVDFGATYSITNNDMNLRGISLSRMILGVLTFLFQMPSFNGVYPFMHTVELSYEYMGRMVVEHFYGGVIATNVICWVLLFTYRFKNEIKEKKIGIYLALNIVISLVIGLVDSNTAGVLQRYSADMAIGLYLSAITLTFLWCIKDKEKGWSFLKISLLSGCVMTLFIICNVDSGITLRLYNPELFGQIGAWFRF